MAERQKTEQGEQEPSIEEILESIRQIISDDGDAAETPSVEDKGAGTLDLSKAEAPKPSREKEVDLDLSKVEENVSSDKGGNLDLSKIDEMFSNDKAVDLDLSKVETRPSFVDNNRSNLDLSSMQVDNSVRDTGNGRLDLSDKEQVFVDKGNGGLDLSDKAQAFVDKGDGGLDLSNKEKAFVDKGDGGLDLSRQERSFAPTMDIDLSVSVKEREFTSDLDLSSKDHNSQSDDDVFELSPAMQVGSTKVENKFRNNNMGSAMEENLNARKDNESLISERTANAAFAELSKLLATNIAVENEDTKHVGKVTFEDMVLELMKPLVKEWIDRHLPTVIERVVQREVEKLTRRAMDR